MTHQLCVAIGGFLHETNTFAPKTADFEAFETADGWPALSRGDSLFDAVEGMNLGVSGFVDAALAQGYHLAPTVWCSAVPSAHVEQDAYERVADMILSDLSSRRPFDAVYLDLHGAMVATHLEDGEGELLRRVRDFVGDEIPIVASLDMHANITPTMVAMADGLIAYRTYPHIDMAATGRRVATFLDRRFAGARPKVAARKSDYLMPLVWQSTDIDPCRSLYARIDELEAARAELWSLSLAAGFPPADIADVGPMVLAYADQQRQADAAADILAGAVAAAEPAFAGQVYTPDEAVAYALASAKGPVIIADTQDNSGAGGQSDTMGMFRALVRAGARDALLGLICDPEVAAGAHLVGEGESMTADLGAKVPWQGETPFHGQFEVIALGDGNFRATGPMFGGSRMQLGPMAWLRHQGIDVVVSSKKMQAADRSMFRHVGIDPERRKIVVLKSSVHFRADFAPVAAEIIIAAAPGPNAVDNRDLPYRHIRSDVRVMPRKIGGD